MPNWYLTPEEDARIQDIFEGKPMKLGMLNVEDTRTQLVLNRALAQVGQALKDHGLYVTVDTDGNYGIDRLPIDFPIKDERVCDRLRRVIYDGHQRDRPLTAIRLSDEHARKLAAELSEMQLNYVTTEAQIYRDLVEGGSRFMDLPVTVQPS